MRLETSDLILVIATIQSQFLIRSPIGAFHGLFDVYAGLYFSVTLEPLADFPRCIPDSLPLDLRRWKRNRCKTRLSLVIRRFLAFPGRFTSLRPLRDFTFFVFGSSGEDRFRLIFTLRYGRCIVFAKSDTRPIGEETLKALGDESGSDSSCGGFCFEPTAQYALCPDPHNDRPEVEPFDAFGCLNIAFADRLGNTVAIGFFSAA